LKIDFKKTGEIIVIQWTTNVDVTGQFIYAIGRDITEIRETQRKFTSKRKITKRCTKKI
jgi:hypothetical protein